MSKLPFITIGLSSHRLEVLPYASQEMRRHDAVVLEEAPEADFGAVLGEDLSIEDYLADKDVEFPLFSTRQLEVLQQLNRLGTAVFQVEPYLERLLQIHELLAQGFSREEVESRPEFTKVYGAESLASQALLAFYARSRSAPFRQIMEAIKDFARADADRFRLRDEMRAEDLIPLTARFRSVYVEAGYIHLYLVKRLKHLLAGRASVKPVFLLTPLARREGGQPQPLGPGDLLTLLYIFRVALPPEKEDLLAARSLIYIKLLHKGELTPGDDPAPHWRDEIRAGRLAARLAYQDCAALYPSILNASSETAVAEVRRYLGEKE